jgi:DNA-binding XRE family transcriptional regulator
MKTSNMPSPVELVKQLRDLVTKTKNKTNYRMVQKIIGTLEISHPERFAQVLKRDPAFRKTLGEWACPNPSGLLTVFSPTHYQELRQAISHNEFRPEDGSPWPTAKLGKEGRAQLIPATLSFDGHLAPEEIQDWSDIMWKQREQLSDLTVDVLDTLSAIWLKSANNANSDAVADIDNLLMLRGLRAKTGRSQEARGFSSQQRQDIFHSLVQIQNLWLSIGQVETIELTPKGHRRRKIKTIQSRAFVITDRMGQLRLDGCIDVEQFVFRPGKVFGEFLFGPGRQTALLSAKALSYDPYRQAWEKRLTRYLSWYWRSTKSTHRGGHYYALETLYSIADSPDKPLGPRKLQDRLEMALKRLEDDGVIRSWCYDDKQKNLRVLIVPPEEHAALSEALELEHKQNLTFEGRFRQRRKSLKLSQAVLAKELGVTQAYLSMIEGGKITEAQLSSDLRESIYKWIEQI